MKLAEFFTHAMEWFALCSAVESLVPNFDRMFSPISGEGVIGGGQPLLIAVEAMLGSLMPTG